MTLPEQPPWKSKAAVILGYLVRCEQWAAVAFLVTILLTMGLQVIARYFFNTPISWSEELARLAMIWLTFTAASFVMARPSGRFAQHRHLHDVLVWCGDGWVGADDAAHAGRPGGD